MEAIDQCIVAMRRGFREDFLDESTGMLRRGFSVYEADGRKHKAFFGSYHNFSDEFISGILLAKVIYGLPLSVVRNVSIALKEYVDKEGRVFFTKVPFFGGAFAILWPTLYVPQDKFPTDWRLLSNFVHIAMDYARVNGHNPGFSRSATGPRDISARWVSRPSLIPAG